MGSMRKKKENKGREEESRGINRQGRILVVEARAVTHGANLAGAG